MCLQPCYICEELSREGKAKTGACMQCNRAGCRQHFHVTWSASFCYRATRSMHGIGMEHVQIETKMSVNSWRNFQVKSVQRLILMLGGLLHIKVHSDICQNPWFSGSLGMVWCSVLICLEKCPNVHSGSDSKCNNCSFR